MNRVSVIFSHILTFIHNSSNQGLHADPVISTVPQLRVPNSQGGSPRCGPPLRSGRHRGGGRVKDSLVGSLVRIRRGVFKGYKGRVVDVNCDAIRIELQSRAHIVTVKDTDICDHVNVTAPHRDTYKMPMSNPGVVFAGRDNDGPWFLPDILVNVRGLDDAPAFGVVREVLLDGACRVALGASGNGDVITANPSEIVVVVPQISDKIKIIGGAQRGTTGELIGVDGKGIVKVDHTLDIKIFDMAILAKLPHPS